MANKFTIDGRSFETNFGDPIRTNLWELIISPPKGVVIDSEKLLIHCRTATIPGRTQEMIESRFGAMKQLFPSRPEFSNTFSVQMEETDDMVIRQFLNTWQEAIFGVNKNSINAGYSSKSAKKDLVAPILELQLFKFNGEKTASKFQFINGIVTGVGDFSLSYDSAETVKYDVTFSYDFHNLVAS